MKPAESIGTGDLTMNHGHLTPGVKSQIARRLYRFDGFDGFDVKYLVSPHARARGAVTLRSAFYSLCGHGVKSVKSVKTPSPSAICGGRRGTSNRVKSCVKWGGFYYAG